MKALTIVREKTGKFIRNNLTKIVLGLVIILVVVNINNLFKFSFSYKLPTPSVDKKTSVITDGKKVSNSEYNKTNELIKEMFAYGNNNEFDKIYEMISDENRKYFGTKEVFLKYIKNIFTEKKRYDLRLYSQKDEYKIYQLKIFGDILATGLTKEKFNYIDTKISTKIDKKSGKLLLNIGGYIVSEKLDGIFENNDLRIEAKSRDVLYNSEIVFYEITNKKNMTLVIKDFASEISEILAAVGTDHRNDIRRTPIILKPFETKLISSEFTKFADSRRTLSNIKFAAIRFYDNYERYTEEEYSNKNFSKNKSKNQYSTILNIERKR